MFEAFRKNSSDSSTSLPPPQPQPLSKPFLIELQQQEKTPSGSFVPASRLGINLIFRTSGLLLALPPEELKNLLFLLSFVSPNGDCRALLPQLAATMHLSSRMTRSRMARLLAFRWHGEPLVLETKAGSGLVAYALHPRLVDYVHAGEPAEEADAPVPLQAASRHEVIEHSRRTYARSRAEAERQIARQLGHEAPGENDENQTLQEGSASTGNPPPSPWPEESAPEISVKQNAQSLRRRLENNGLTTEQADNLLSTYPWQRIEQQLGWLPFRNAKNPAAFLTAAIEGFYEEPRLLRQRKGKTKP